MREGGADKLGLGEKAQLTLRNWLLISENYEFSSALFGKMLEP